MEERKELDKIPSFCDFFESRRLIMTAVMKRAKEKRAQGQIVTNLDFKRLCREEWAAMKEKQKVCAGI